MMNEPSTIIVKTKADPTTRNTIIDENDTKQQQQQQQTWSVVVASDSTYGSFHTQRKRSVGFIHVIISINVLLMMMLVILDPTEIGSRNNNNSIMMEHTDTVRALSSPSLRWNQNVPLRNNRPNTHHPKDQQQEPTHIQRQRLTMDNTTVSNTTINITINNNNNTDNQYDPTRITTGPDARIIGGQPVLNESAGRYPYYVALRNGNDDHICGGTLIAVDMVLTAAHCYGGLEMAVIGLEGRTTNGDDNDEAEHIEIDGQYMNPKFNYDLLHYDQMVIKLRTPSLYHSPVQVNLQPISDESTTATTTTDDIDSTSSRSHTTARGRWRPTSSSSTVINNTSSSNDTARDDDDEEDEDNEDDIVIIGFGDITTSDVSSGGVNQGMGPVKPTVLQETTVRYIPNDECKTAKVGEIDFANHVTDDMICTMGENSGQCHGDSGGPYLILGDGPNEDLQIGIVSWGVGCAHESFPSVGARTGVTHWIRSITCQYSSNPPEYFECDNRDSFTYSPSPTLAPSVPSISPAPTVYKVPVLLTIRFDEYSHEVGWSIWDDNEETLYRSVSVTTYDKLEVVHEVTMLPPGHNFTFIIIDRNADGIMGAGTRYELKLSIDSETGEPSSSDYSNADDSRSFVLVEGDGDFGAIRKHNFYLPVQDEFPTSAPVAPSVSPAPTLYTVQAYLAIQFDSWPEETGWSIVDAVEDYPNVVYATVPSGTYWAYSNVTETIPLPPGRDYALIMTDSYGDGMKEPDAYILWMLVDDAGSSLVNSSAADSDNVDGSTQQKVTLAQGGGNFGLSIVHNFALPP